MRVRVRKTASSSEHDVSAPPGLSRVKLSGPQILVELQRSAGNRAVSSALRAWQTDSAATNQTSIQRASTTTMEAATVGSYGAITDLAIERPATVTGTIKPSSTSGRPSAPSPWVVLSLAKAYTLKANQVPGASKKSSPTVWKELFGSSTYDRGHVMGLQLGGSDISQNIVPQWSLNQQSGKWRGIEKKAVEKQNGQAVKYKVNYAANAGDWHRVMIPSGIEVEFAGVPASGEQKWNNQFSPNDQRRLNLGMDVIYTGYADVRDDLDGKYDVDPGSATTLIHELALTVLSHHQTQAEFSRGADYVKLQDQYREYFTNDPEGRKQAAQLEERTSKRLLKDGTIRLNQDGTYHFGKRPRDYATYDCPVCFHPFSSRKNLSRHMTKLGHLPGPSGQS